MKPKLFLINLLICLSFPLLAQNSIEGTWVLPHFTRYYDYIYIETEDEPAQELNTTHIKIKDNEITFEGKKFYLHSWTFYDEVLVEEHDETFYPEEETEEEVEYEYTEEEETEEEVEYEYTEEEYEETVEYPRKVNKEKVFVIDTQITQGEKHLTITFHEKEDSLFGFLTLKFISEKRAYLKSYYGFRELPDTAKMKIDWEQEDLPIIYIEKEFEELSKKSDFPTDDEEKYLEFWKSYLTEIKKETYQAKLKNLDLEFQMNLLKGKHLTNELTQNTLEKLNYNIFASLGKLHKSNRKFAYPEKLRTLIRGKISDEDIDNIKTQLNQEWYANIMLPILGGWEFGYPDRASTEIPEVNMSFDMDYPNLGVNWDLKGMPKDTPPPPSQYQSFSIEAQSISIGTDKSNGTIVFLIPANFLDSPKEEETFVVLQFLYLSDSTVSFKPLRNEFKTLEEAQRLFEDLPKEKESFMLGLGGNTPTIHLINPNQKKRQDKLPVLEPNQTLIDSIANHVIAKLEKQDSQAITRYPFNYDKKNKNPQKKTRFLIYAGDLCKEVLESMGYHPIESYKAILKFQLSQAKYWEIETLKEDLETTKKEYEKIKTALDKPDSLKSRREKNYDKYDLEDVDEEIKNLENKLKVANLQLKLDSLEKAGQGYSKEAEDIRDIIEFEQKYKRFSYSRNRGNYFLEEIEDTYENAEEYLKKQKELDKTLSDKQKKKQRKVKEKATKERKEKEEKRKKENPNEEFIEEYDDYEVDYTQKEEILSDIQLFLEEVTYYLYEIKTERTELEMFIEKYKERFPEKMKPLKEKAQKSKEIPQKIQELMDKLVVIEKELKAIEEWEEPEK